MSTTTEQHLGSFHVEHDYETLQACVICGSTELRMALKTKDHSISKEAFQISECSACGLYFTNPRPVQSAIGRYYDSPNYISHSNTKRSFDDRLYQTARSWAIRQKHALVSSCIPTGAILDIGCGTGEFLAYLMGRGYRTSGVEPGLQARAQAIQNHNLYVVPNIDRLVSQEQFQVVTMWHALEHIPDPRATVKRVFALLEQGGWFIIAVPDRDSWDAKHYGSMWAAWDVPRHLSHFRRTDISTLLQDQGFDVLPTRRMLLDAPYICMLSERYAGRSNIKALALGVIKGLWSNMQSLIFARPTSSTLYIARKTKG